LGRSNEQEARQGFTPGPWVADLDGVGWQPGNGQEDHNEVCLLGHDQYDAVSVYAPGKYPPSADYAEFSANARLIAAAPDLLDAVLTLMDQPTMNPLSMTPEQRNALWAAHAKARAAISKATGA
jgi:hypothetical protein